jgi:hypothetical protein
MGSNPLIGPNDEKLGERFPDMTEVYKKSLIEIAEKCAKDLNIDIKKDDELEFPTGKRKVISLQDSGPYINIFVDGEKLDPIKDGYPNKIKLIRE